MTTTNTQNQYGFNEARYNEKYAAELNSVFDYLFGSGQKSRRRTDTEDRGEHWFNMDGKDIHASVMIDLQDSLMGASRQFKIEIPVITPRGELVNQKKTLTVRIPKGITEGERIRVAKRGSPGMGAAAGDLLLEVAFNKHERYTVEGKNIYFNLPVTPRELAFGAKVRVLAPNSRSRKITVNIPKNSRQGNKICLEGYGIPSQKPGDFYVV